MFSWKALRRKKSVTPKNKKPTRPVSTQTLRSTASPDNNYAVRRALTEESTSGWTVKSRKSQVPEVKDKQSIQFLEDQYIDQSQPNALPQYVLNQEYYEPQQSKDLVTEKYNELKRELDDINTQFEKDKDILQSLKKLSPRNNDEVNINKEADLIKTMLNSLISRDQQHTNIELKERMDEKKRHEQETEAVEAHLKNLEEAMDSTKKHFQYPEHSQRITELFNSLNNTFINYSKNNPKGRGSLRTDYNRVLMFIIDKDIKCNYCNLIQTSTKYIQEKTKINDVNWTENLNNKVAISLSSVKHKYSAFDVLKIDYIPNDVVEELHKLCSGYKNKIRTEFNPDGECQIFEINGYNLLLRFTPVSKPQINGFTTSSSLSPQPSTSSKRRNNLLSSFSFRPNTQKQTK